MPELVFSEEGHIYTVGGVEVPSVTQILRAVRVHRKDGSVGSWFDYGMLSESKSEEVMARGTWIADICALRLQRIAEGPFPSEVLQQFAAEAPDWFPYYPPFEQWLVRQLALGFAPLLIEQPLYSYRHRFAGRPDIVCLRMGRIPTIIEIKTGVALPETAIQTALQEMLLHDQDGLDGQLSYPYCGQTHERYSLQLQPDQEARLIPHRAGTADRNLALAALTLFHHHHQNGASNGK